MTKKSFARMTRDSQKQGKLNDSPANWDEVLQQNEDLARLMISSRCVIDAHLENPELIQHSPNKQAYSGAMATVAKNYSELGAELISLKDRIGTRRGTITDPNEVMDNIDIGVAHANLVTKLDEVYRPALAILQEQINLAVRCYNTTLSEKRAGATASDTEQTTAA